MKTAFKSRLTGVISQSRKSAVRNSFKQAAVQMPAVSLAYTALSSGNVNALGSQSAAGPILNQNDVLLGSSLPIDYSSTYDTQTAAAPVAGGGGDGINSNVAPVYGYVAGDVSGLGSGVQAILMNNKWGTGLGTGAQLTYSFSRQGSVYNALIFGAVPDKSTIGELSNSLKTGVRSALFQYSAFTNLSFIEVADTASTAGDIRVAMAGARSGSAQTFYPNATASAGDVFVDNSLAGQIPTAGSYMYYLLVHELGHSLGLRHSSDSSISGSVEDQLKYTVMSYRSYAGASTAYVSNSYFPTTPMYNDIKALQMLYGVNTTYHAGNDTYQWDANKSIFETIYDAGGNDTLNASNQAQAVTLNLNSGQWSQIGVTFDRGDGQQVRDCLTIADGCVIENAVGSAFNDTLIGNAASNTLSGGVGNDTLQGGDGNDTLNGDMGDDLLQGGDGDDILNGSNGNDTLQGGAGSDVLYGGLGTDTYVYQLGNGTDTVYGQRNFDVVQLGSGIAMNDWFFDRNADDLSVVIRQNGVETGRVVLKNQNTSNTRLANTGVRKVNLSNGDSINMIVGAGGDQVLYAGTLNDYIFSRYANGSAYGGSGNDIMESSNSGTLNGQAGADTYIYQVGDGRVTVVGQRSEDTLQLGSTISRSDLSFVRSGDNLELVVSQAGVVSNRVVLTGQYAATDTGVKQFKFSNGNTIGTMIGSNSVETLIGTAADDYIYAGAGNDTLNGGAGSDMLDGALGADTYLFQRTGGADTVLQNGLGESGDSLLLASDVNSQQLWFTHTGNDLNVSIIGTSDSINFKDWYSGMGYQLGSIKAGDGKVLAVNDVETLVTAMAGFAPPASGQTTLTTDYQTLNPILVANWH